MPDIGCLHLKLKPLSSASDISKPEQGEKLEVVLECEDCGATFSGMVYAEAESST